MATGVIEFSKLRNDLAVANLDRLSRYEPPPPDQGFLGSDKSWNPGKELLIKWSKTHLESIQKSIDREAFGGKQDIDWNIAFLPFMESCAVYLRDWGTYLKAWTTYRQYKKDNAKDDNMRERALSLYNEAFRGIDEVAAVWEMKFLQVCDLIHKSPSGHPSWDGPYCGAFFTADHNKDTPLIGIAFKGTNPFNRREIHVDYNYDLERAQSYLNNQLVSIGVYTGLFGKFDNEDITPYEDIITKIESVAQDMSELSGKLIRTHVTGHSLGGSYSSLCYAQLLIDTTQTPVSPRPSPRYFVPGDEYTFGAPRVGNEKWSVLNSDLVGSHSGQSWRIVHDQDIVPQVPPTAFKPEQLDFYHIDKGKRIFKHKAPEDIETEQGGPRPKPYEIKTFDDFIKAIWQAIDHGELNCFCFCASLMFVSQSLTFTTMRWTTLSNIHET